jgi:hypothetical protein
VLQRNRALRPDLVLHGAQGTLVSDVCVTHPLAPSYRDKRERQTDSGLTPVIAHLEHVKTAKYAALVRSRAEYDNSKFVPFVCDVYGGIGDGANELITWLRREAEWGAGLDGSDLFGDGCGGVSRARLQQRSALVRLSVEIQRAVARGAADGARLVRASSGRRANASAF